jgi:hypothetical protein
LIIPDALAAASQLKSGAEVFKSSVFKNAKFMPHFALINYSAGLL